MRNAPILASRNLPKSTHDHRRVPMVFIVEGGLNYLRGNDAPYFTLTYTSHRKGFPNQCYSGGAGHEEILRYFPRFAQLARMHLSDINGVPMHAEANGWYHLAGALPDHAGEKYHTGESKRHMPKPEGAERANEWDTTDYRNPTADECLAIFAEHVRVDINLARTVKTRVIAEAVVHGTGGYDPVYNWTAGRAWFAQWIDEQRPRWKAEADACIAEYGLVVFGDQWPPAESEK